MVFISIALAALASQPVRAEDQAATTAAQFGAICASVKADCGSCGGRAKRGAPNTPALASELPAAKLNEPVPRVAGRPLDGWGHPVQITVDGQGVKLESAGPDGELGNADDLAQRCPGK